MKWKNLPGNPKSMKCPQLEKDWPMNSRQNGTGNCQLPKRRKSSVNRKLSPKKVIPFGSPKSATAGGPDLVLPAGKREISRFCIEVAHNEQLLGAAWMHARGRTQRRGFLRKNLWRRKKGLFKKENWVLQSFIACCFFPPKTGAPEKLAGNFKCVQCSIHLGDDPNCLYNIFQMLRYMRQETQRLNPRNLREVVLTDTPCSLAKGRKEEQRNDM